MVLNCSTLVIYRGGDSSDFVNLIHVLLMALFGFLFFFEQLMMITVTAACSRKGHTEGGDVPCQ